MQPETYPISKPKKHFALLDGMRGVAALIILIFHYAEIIIPDLSKNILAHGFLAVDFFFCLSGFVIAYAYDDRLPQMSIGQFIKQRLKRLHPLVILGSILGLITFVFDPFGDAISKYSILQVIILFLCSALLIPNASMEDRYFNNFGLNAPSWSLFWEYVANIAYALLLVRLPKKALAILAIIGAIILIYTSKSANNLLGGWNGETFWHGGARVLFSFTIGMCIYRFNWILKNNIGFLGLSLLLILAFFVPYTESTSWVVESLIVLIYFPIMIALGAGSTKQESNKKLSTWLGNISYPLYITHYAVMWAFGAYYAKFQPDTFTLISVSVGLAIIQILIAYLAMKYYDTPIRKKLNTYS